VRVNVRVRMRACDQRPWKMLRVHNCGLAVAWTLFVGTPRVTPGALETLDGGSHVFGRIYVCARLGFAVHHKECAHRDGPPVAMGRDLTVL
jgi:hypothetical protein